MWPDLTVDDADYLEHLRARFDDPRSLRSAAVEDLYLACACLRRAPGSAEAFAALVRPGIEKALLGFSDQGSFREEITQRVLSRLLVPNGAKPAKLERYAGRSSLDRWVRAVAVRLALDTVRGRGRNEDPTGNAALLDRVDDADPELLYLSDHYQAEFKRAFEEAVAELEASDRRWLREHFVFGLSTAKLAALHQVHKSTAARHLAMARELLIEKVRARIAQRLRLDDERALRSVLKAVSSQLDVSLARVLGPED